MASYVFWVSLFNEFDTNKKLKYDFAPHRLKGRTSDPAKVVAGDALESIYKAGGVDPKLAWDVSPLWGDLRRGDFVAKIVKEKDGPATYALATLIGLEGEEL